MDSGPVSEPSGSRLGDWPPAEGRYMVGNKDSPVAICTMASVDLRFPMDRVAIAGKCVTENLGIEKIVRNLASNPSIRYLIVAGRESMGHFVDDALEKLVEGGVDGEGRIMGAKGGIPVLKNVSAGEIERFRKQVRIINMAGETDTARIMEKVNELYPKGEPFRGGPVEAQEPARMAAPAHPISDWVQDTKGYFTISVDSSKGVIALEHHEGSGRITGVITGRNAEDLYHHAVNGLGLVSRLDHAAYLGRELAKAETALFNGLDYEQDIGLIVPAARQDPGARIDTDGKEYTRLPTHGKLVSVRKIEKTREMVLTYVVNDREFPLRTRSHSEEESFREFLKSHGMCRVF